MKILILVCISSGVALMVMLILKAVQEKHDILLFWPDFRDKIERRLKIVRDRIKVLFRHFTKQNLYISLHFVLVKIRHLFAWVVAHLDKKSYHLISQVKGKQNIERGTSSPFLHDITKAKDALRKE